MLNEEKMLYIPPPNHKFDLCIACPAHNLKFRILKNVTTFYNIEGMIIIFTLKYHTWDQLDQLPYFTNGDVGT